MGNIKLTESIITLYYRTSDIKRVARIVLILWFEHLVKSVFDRHTGSGPLIKLKDTHS